MSSHTPPRLLTPCPVVCTPCCMPLCRHCPLHTTAATLSHATTTAFYPLHPSVPIPHPIVCTVPSCATTPPLPSTCCCCPLHAAAATHSVPPPPPLCATPAAPMCHPCRPYVPPLPLLCAIAGLTAGCCLYMLPPLPPLCAIAGLTAGCCLYMLPPLPFMAATGPRHLSYPPCLPWPIYLQCCHLCPQTMDHGPCLQLSCMHHTQPGPLGVHIAVACVLPMSTPLTQAHAPPLCAPHVSALSLAPSTAMPHVLAPIMCALISQAPSMAMPHVSAPVVCALASWAPSAAMQHDHMTVFMSHSCATGWHTHIGRAWETVDTLYEHV